MLLKNIISSILNLIYPIVKRWIPFQIYAYLAVGAANTILNILLFTLFFRVILKQEVYTAFSFSMASYTLALIIAFIITVPTGFWLSKQFAFTNAAVQQNGVQLGKYFLVVLQGLVSDYLLFKASIVFFNLDPVLAKVLSTVIVLTVNYLLQKYFTFKATPKVSKDSAESIP